jgi:hypothetical protein
MGDQTYQHFRASISFPGVSRHLRIRVVCWRTAMRASSRRRAWSSGGAGFDMVRVLLPVPAASSARYWGTGQSMQVGESAARGWCTKGCCRGIKKRLLLLQVSGNDDARSGTAPQQTPGTQPSSQDSTVAQWLPCVCCCRDQDRLCKAPLRPFPHPIAPLLSSSPIPFHDPRGWNHN